MTATKTQDEFVEQASKKHNNKYDYSCVKYVNTNTKVTIICPIHGKFIQSPSSHIKGQGCKICGIKNHPKKDNTASFIKKATIKHNNKYDYSQVAYNNYNEHVTIICNMHGPFQMKPLVHMRGLGCKQCGIIKRSNYNTKTLDDFILRAKKIHGDIYNYSNSVYVKAHDNISIICKQHGEFIIKAYLHTNNKIGCPKCTIKSRGEIAISTFLDQHNIKYSTEHKFKNCVDKTQLRYDFYIPSYNMLIEFDGIQHYKFIPAFHKSVNDFNITKLHDKIKNDFASTHNINLLRIPHYQINRINKILYQSLLEETCQH